MEDTAALLVVDVQQGSTLLVTVMTAGELTRATATSLHDEFATVVSTRELVSA